MCRLLFLFFKKKECFAQGAFSLLKWLYKKLKVRKLARKCGKDITSVSLVRSFICKRNTVFDQCMYKRGRCALFLAIFNNNFGRVFTLREEHIGRARNQALIKVDDCDDLSKGVAGRRCRT